MTHRLLIPLVLAACCGCTLLQRDNAKLSKQVAEGRDDRQQGIRRIDHGDWAGGERDLVAAIALCPTDAEARQYYAEALWRRGDRAKAVVQMEQARRLSGHDPSLAVRAGEMWLEMGNLTDAGRLADDAVAAEPRLGSAWLLRGRIALAQGRTDDALAAMQRALEYQHDDRRALLMTAELYRQLNRPERALNMLETLRDCYAPGEEPQRVLALQGLSLVALARYDDAVEAYKLAVDRERPTAELYERLAEAQLLAGRPADAAGSISEALALEPGRGTSRQLAQRIDVAMHAAAGVRRE